MHRHVPRGVLAVVYSERWNLSRLEQGQALRTYGSEHTFELTRLKDVTRGVVAP